MSSSQTYLCTLKLVTVDEPGAHHSTCATCESKQQQSSFTSSADIFKRTPNSCLCTTLIIHQMIMKQADVTFASFTVNSNDVFGVSRHPLPHAGCVFQHVPETDTTDPVQHTVIQTLRQALQKIKMYIPQSRQLVMRPRCIMVRGLLKLGQGEWRIYHYACHDMMLPQFP